MNHNLISNKLNRYRNKMFYNKFRKILRYNSLLKRKMINSQILIVMILRRYHKSHKVKILMDSTSMIYMLLANKKSMK